MYDIINLIIIWEKNIYSLSKVILLRRDNFQRGILNWFWKNFLKMCQVLVDLFKIVLLFFSVFCLRVYFNDFVRVLNQFFFFSLLCQLICYCFFYVVLELVIKFYFLVLNIKLIKDVVILNIYFQMKV